MYGLIYCIKNKTNGKCYVGQTKQVLYRRIAGHRQDSKRLKKVLSVKFYNAVNKYGWNNFEWFVL